MNAIYLDRSNTKKGKFIINSLEEIKKKIENNFNCINKS